MHITSIKQEPTTKQVGFENEPKMILKIPKVYSESVYLRGTNNRMAKKVQKDKQRSTRHTYTTKD